MFRFVKNTAAAATVSLGALMASSALAGQGISDIDVQAGIAAPQGSNALDYYPTIAEDLEREILERVAVSDDPTGPKIKVQIRSVSLDGDTILPDTAEFNELEGYVSYNGGSRDLGEVIKLSAHTDNTVAGPGVVTIPPSQEDFYDAMLTAFADRVIELVPAEDIQG